VELKPGEHQLSATWTGKKLHAYVSTTIELAAKTTLALAGSMIEVIPVQGGSFMREGSSITVSSFFIGKNEVTQAQYQDVTGRNPSNFKGDPKLPVETVSWYDAVAFCNVLSTKEGLQTVYFINGRDVSADFTRNGWRLPTEAEWEYAARGGSASKGYTYSGGSDVGTVAWYDGNSGSKTHAVGTKAPNELGLHDMSGNVWEWCNDWYGSYIKGSQANPLGAASGSNRVLRGGFWSSDASFITVAYRDSTGPDARAGGIGFRLLRTP